MSRIPNNNKGVSFAKQRSVARRTSPFQRSYSEMSSTYFSEISSTEISDTEAATTVYRKSKRSQVKAHPMQIETPLSKFIKIGGFFGLLIMITMMATVIFCAADKDRGTITSSLAQKMGYANHVVESENGTNTTDAETRQNSTTASGSTIVVRNDGSSSSCPAGLVTAIVVGILAVAGSIVALIMCTGDRSCGCTYHCCCGSENPTYPTTCEAAATDGIEGNSICDAGFEYDSTKAKFTIASDTEFSTTCCKIINGINKKSCAEMHAEFDNPSSCGAGHEYDASTADRKVSQADYSVECCKIIGGIITSEKTCSELHTEGSQTCEAGFDYDSDKAETKVAADTDYATDCCKSSSV